MPDILMLDCLDEDESVKDNCGKVTMSPGVIPDLLLVCRPSAVKGVLMGSITKSPDRCNQIGVAC